MVRETKSRVEATIGARSVGLTLLFEKYLPSGAIPPRRATYAASERRERQFSGPDGVETVVLPRTAKVPVSDDWLEHLEFAFRDEGVDLGLCAALFRVLPRAEVEGRLNAALDASPYAKHLRRIWFVYEYVTPHKLARPDAPANATYEPLLDPGVYFTGDPRKSRRHYVVDNLLGDRAFCPSVRRVEGLGEDRTAALKARMPEIVAGVDASRLERAIDFLYLRETKSSYAIERETPDQKRTARFVSLLREAPVLQLDERSLAGAQARIVEAKFAESSYRAEQNYVGETVSLTQERVHYPCPPPALVPSLMSGWATTDARLEAAGVDVLVAAAVTGFGFVFIHPFEDGNGRLHRLLIHRGLSRGVLAPPGFVLPVSAVMLRRRRDYDHALESVSRDVEAAVDYVLDDSGRMTIRGDVEHLYRYPDLTQVALFLADCVETTVAEDLPDQLRFLVQHDAARKAAQSIVDMPDGDLRLLLRLLMQNGFKLSEAKRDRFSRLTDAEVERIESAVAEAFDGKPPVEPGE